MATRAAIENLEHYIREAQLILDKYATQHHVSRYVQSQYDPSEVEQLLADHVQTRAAKLGQALAELQSWLQDQSTVRPILRRKDHRPRRRLEGRKYRTP